MAAVVYTEHKDELVPVHIGVPALKVAAGKPAAGTQAFLTPRSLEAAERAVAEQEARAADAEAEAQRAFAALETARKTPREAAAMEAALQAKSKAAAAEGSVAASLGVYELATNRGFGRMTVERYATEEDARTVADTLWVSWVIFHEQRGSRSEVAYGGLGWAQGAIRRRMQAATTSSMNRVMYGKVDG